MRPYTCASQGYDRRSQVPMEAMPRSTATAGGRYGDALLRCHRAFLPRRQLWTPTSQGRSRGQERARLRQQSIHATPPSRTETRPAAAIATASLVDRAPWSERQRDAVCRRNEMDSKRGACRLPEPCECRSPRRTGSPNRVPAARRLRRRTGRVTCRGPGRQGRRGSLPLPICARW